MIFSFGTAGRNILFADGAQNLDLAVIKRTHFGRELRGVDVDFRAEFFNLPNHPQFGQPDLDFSSTTFGQIFTTARGNRKSDPVRVKAEFLSSSQDFAAKSLLDEVSTVTR